MEQSQWLAQDEAWELAEDAGRLKLIGDELVDVLIYGLSFAGVLHLDVATAVVHKLARNAKKYPEDEDLGRASWLHRTKGGDA